MSSVDVIRSPEMLVRAAIPHGMFGTALGGGRPG